jgi:hypothetical protein
MASDDRDLLRILRAELASLDAGGYENNVPKWRTGLVFEDSPSCLNHNGLQRRRPCEECVLSRLVPRDARFAAIPCRHISLNTNGVTLDDLYRSASYEEAKQTVREWLCNTIAQMENSVAVRVHS